MSEIVDGVMITPEVRALERIFSGDNEELCDKDKILLMRNIARVYLIEFFDRQGMKDNNPYRGLS